MERLTTADGFAFGAFVVRPVGAPRGCVIVLHEAFGVTPHIENVCARFAGEGFVAMAPALLAFASGNPDGVVFAQDKDGLDGGRELILQTTKEQIVACVQACVAWGSAQGLKSVAAGFCWGGSCAYIAACAVPGLAAASAYYGGRLKELVAEAQAKCPALVHLAVLDRYIPCEETRVAFEQYDPATPVFVYEADHGFNRDDGKTFDEQAAALAWTRTMELFAKSMS